MLRVDIFLRSYLVVTTLFIVFLSSTSNAHPTTSGRSIRVDRNLSLIESYNVIDNECNKRTEDVNNWRRCVHAASFQLGIERSGMSQAGTCSARDSQEKWGRGLVLITQSRSGSHWLMDMLVMRPDVKWIMPEVTNMFSKDLQENRYLGLLGGIFDILEKNECDGLYRGVGIPFRKPPILWLNEDPVLWPLLDTLVANNQIKVLFLSRRDVFARTVSWTRSKILDEYRKQDKHSTCGNPWRLDPESPCATADILVDTKVFVKRYLHNKMEREKMIAAYEELLVGRRASVMFLDYEEMVQANGLPSSVERFLGIKRTPTSEQVASIKKSGRKSPLSIVQNKEELCAQLHAVGEFPVHCESLKMEK